MHLPLYSASDDHHVVTSVSQEVTATAAVIKFAQTHTLATFPKHTTLPHRQSPLRSHPLTKATGVRQTLQTLSLKEEFQ